MAHKTSATTVRKETTSPMTKSEAVKLFRGHCRRAPLTSLFESLGNKSLWTESNDKTIARVVEKAVEDSSKSSWYLLVEFFSHMSEESFRRAMIDCLAASHDRLRKFVTELTNKVTTKDAASLKLVFSAFVCILRSAVLPPEAKETFATEIIQSAVRSAQGHDAWFSGDEPNLHLEHSDDFLKKLEEEQQVEVIQVLMASDNQACQAFGLLWASSLSRWELIGPIEKLDLISGYTALAIFQDALSSKALESAGWVLQNVLSSPASHPSSLVKGRDVLPMLGGIVERTIRDALLCKKNNEIPGFIEVCRKKQLYGAGALVALWGRDLKEARKLAQQEENENAFMRILKELMGRSLWSVTLQLMSSQQNDPDQRMLKMVLRRAAKCCIQPAPRFVLEKLMPRCQDKSFLGREVLSRIMYYCKSKLFSKFVDKDLLDLSDPSVLGGPVLSIVVSFVTGYMSNIYDISPSPKSEAYISMLKKCVEVGLSTQLPLTSLSVDSATARLEEFKSGTPQSVASPLLTASRAGHLALVNFIYRCGATSNAELYQLSKNAGLREALTYKRLPSIVAFLDLLARTPRSLKDMCRLVVSRHIGCRSDRKQRALGLGLPMKLVRYVLLHDVLYPD